MTDSKTVVEDLAAWLTQIWDEEERLAESAVGDVAAMQIDNYGHLTVPAAWVLARITADRKILARYEQALENRRQHPGDLASAGALLALLGAVKDLASAHADKPGFRPEWSVERQGVEW